tara:strand:+ start:3412 stop:3717 length:306 start_codon:yes stop_codon:yes gene_type:complete
VKVKAKILGYFGGVRRRPGDIFEIDNEEQRGSWMIGVDEPLPTPKEAMPFTSKIEGTKAGGNLMPVGKDAWEEPVGESKVVMAVAEPEEKHTVKSKPKRRR